MRRDVRSLVVAGLLLGACGPDPLPIVGDEGSVGSAGDGDGDYGDGDGDSVYGDGDGDGSTESAPPPFSRDLTGLVQNTAQWGDFTVKLVAARVERGMDESWGDGGYAALAPNDVYLELDVELGNLQHADNTLVQRDTWDIVLPDASRIELQASFGASLSPLGTASYTIRYPVSEAFELTGAKLELNGPQRGQLQPELIPLDSAYEPDIAVVVMELDGHVIDSARPDSFSRCQMNVRSARLSRNSLSEGRALYGQYFLDMDLGITFSGRGHSHSIDNSSFRVDVAGESFEPESHISEVLNAGLVWNTPLMFALEDTVREFDVRFLVGWDDEMTPEYEWKTVHVRW